MPRRNRKRHMQMRHKKMKMRHKKCKSKEGKRMKTFSNAVQLEFTVDTLEKVFEYLRMKDLCRAAQVCKFWNLVANAEMKNRGPEILFVEREFQDSILNTIKVKPYLTICMRNIFTLERIVDYIKSSCRPFLGKLLFFIAANSRAVLGGRPLLGLLDDPMDLSYLILPQTYRKSEFAFVCYADVNKNYLSVKRFCEEEVQKLLPKGESTHTTYLLFSSCIDTPIIVNYLLTRVAQDKFTLWGGTCNSICAYDPNMPQGAWNPTEMQIALISITGPTVVSWSILIPHSVNESKFKEQLLDFKSTLSLRRYSIGLIIGPELGVSRDGSYYIKTSIGQIVGVGKLIDSSKISEVFQQIFPGMPFINAQTWSSERTQNYIGVNSQTDLFSLPVVSFSISIIIISYN